LLSDLGFLEGFEFGFAFFAAEALVFAHGFEAFATAGTKWVLAAGLGSKLEHPDFFQVKR
jgi:hypothetical protein